ncbi:site-specific integrase [Tellurirhabdus rosea]|uniref:site-specific integrase n=1 Tax=Tellurirhabdus rosea TaxID=2674997 RepID=UPI00224F2CFB|nr:site-specific integrase [Tellurirhabdus rosea]
MSRTTSHKEGTARVKIVYFTSKTLADGSHPFVVRIHKDKTRQHISTGLSLHPKYWNPEKNEIRRSYPEPHRENLINALKKLEEKYTKAAKDLAALDESHDAAAVASKAAESRQKVRSIKLLAYMDELVEAMVKSGRRGNSIVYRDLRNQIADFLTVEFEGSSDITFAEANVRFCNQLETFLRQRGNIDNTLSNRYRTLRAVFNRAIAEGIVKSEHYPFARNTAEKHKFSIGKFDTTTQKRAISREEIRLIEAYEPVGVHTAEEFKGKRNARAIARIKNEAEIERLRLVKAVFLFSFYAGGINFVDLAQLRWENLSYDAQGGLRLTYKRQKTGGKFSFALLKPAAAIIEQFKPLTFDGPASYIFPILDHKRHKTDNQTANRLHKMSGQVNKDLKTIGERLGITIPITTYVARHSFATNLRQSGVSTAVISQAMGHKSESVTAVYLESFANEMVDEAIRNLL